MVSEAKRTVLFSDIRDFTSLTAQKGDREAFRLVKTFTSIVEEQVSDQGGELVKTYGDGVLTTFPARVNGLEASIGMQRSLSRHNEANPEDTITAGIGLNWGDTIEEEGDIFGHAVNLAARLGNYAKGGQIIVSASCRNSADSKNFKYLDLGTRELEGIGEEKIYELLWREEVGRLKTKNDELALILTEDSLAIELSKSLNEEITQARQEIKREMEGSSGFTRYILKKIDGFLENRVSGFLEKILRKKGIGLEHDVEDLQLESSSDGLTLYRSGEELLELPAEELNSSETEDFVSKFSNLGKG